MIPENFLTRLRILVVQTVLVLVFVQTAHAGGPMAVVGGRPFKWNATVPIKYKIDLGTLGNLSNDTASALVDSSFKVWADLPSATIDFENDGHLDVDVVLKNVAQALLDRPKGTTVVAFDSDGTITDGLFGQGSKIDILGFTAVDQANFLNAEDQGGVSVFNGFFISRFNLTAEEFQGTLIHEFGHLAGLDHTQLNGDFVSDGDSSNDQFIPVMYPIASRDNPLAAKTLKLDDVAWISTLYPASDFAATTGEISGAVQAGDSGPVQGANVIGRLISDPFAKAVSCVAGFLVANRGQFTLPGLPPGDYEIRMEPVDPRFVAGSSVGPFAPPRTGIISEGYNGSSESAFPRDDDPAQTTPVNVIQGQQTLNIVFAANEVYLAPQNTITFDDLSANLAVGDQLKSKGVIFSGTARVFQSGNNRWVVNFDPLSQDPLGDIEGFFVDPTTGQPTTVGFVQVVDDTAQGTGTLVALDARGQQLGSVSAANSSDLLTIEAPGIASFKFSDADGDHLTGFDYLAFEGLAPGGSETDSYEPNDSSETTVDIAVPTLLSGTVSPEGDVDFFSFDAAAGTFIVLDVDAAELGSLLDSRLVLGDSQGETIAEDDDAVPFSLDSRIVARLDRAGRYQVMLFDFTNSGGPGFDYQLHVSQAEKKDSNEVNDTKGMATPVGLPRHVSGSVDPKGDIDYFSFLGEAGMFFRAESVGTFTPALLLLDHRGTLIASNLQELVGTQVASSDPLLVDLATSETLYLVVTHPGLGGGPEFGYDVDLSLLTPEEAFPGLIETPSLVCPLTLALHADPFSWILERARVVRDRALLSNSAGSRAVTAYYHAAPALARTVAHFKAPGAHQ